jgi:hypothetical protein
MSNNGIKLINNNTNYKNINNMKCTVFDTGDHVKIIHPNLKVNLEGVIFHILNKNEFNSEYNVLIFIKDNNYVWCREKNLSLLTSNKDKIIINNHDLNNYFDDSIDIETFLNDFNSSLL